MSWKDIVAQCGCVIEMDIRHDWESGVTDAEDVSIISLCEKHSRNNLESRLAAEQLAEALKPIAKIGRCVDENGYFEIILLGAEINAAITAIAAWQKGE